MVADTLIFFRTAGFRLLVVGSWLLVLGCWLLVVGAPTYSSIRIRVSSFKFQGSSPHLLTSLSHIAYLTSHIPHPPLPISIPHHPAQHITFYFTIPPASISPSTVRTASFPFSSDAASSIPWDS